MRRFLILLALLLLGSWTHGSSPPANASIPTSSLSPGNFSANNWSGFATPATTVSTSNGFKYIQSSTNVTGQMLATGTGNWRDEEITTYFDYGGILFLRLSGGNGLYAAFNQTAANSLTIGIITGFDPTSPQNGGTKYQTYAQTNPSGCVTNWPTTGGHTFTFGARGFNVYLKIDGVLAVDTCQTASLLNPTGTISYTEYRLQGMSYGTVAAWADPRGAGARDISVTYYGATFLYSGYNAGVFDPRDFGMKVVPVVTGSITGGTATLNLNTPANFEIGDFVIVEVGGEASPGYNTIGVGGVSPVLHYANAAARNADHSQADGTYAYLDTDGSVDVYNAGTTTWALADQGGGGSYYVGVKTALSLVARVNAVNASPATQLTLAVNASVTATNANVYLDSLPSFYPFTTSPTAYFAGVLDGLNAYPNMTLTVPAGTWYFSNGASPVNSGPGTDRQAFTLRGAGIASTTVQSPKGVPSQFLDTKQANNVAVSDFSYVGNLADVGYGFATVGANKQFFGDMPIAVQGVGSNILAQRIACLNDIRGCIVLTGVNIQILNSTVTINQPQRSYLEWEFSLNNCSGTSQIANSTATGSFLLKSFEMFNCNGAGINNVTGTNALFSTNSSSNWTISGIVDTIAANSYLNTNSGALDEAILNISSNAFHTGGTGTISNPRIIQSGYVNSNSDSLKFIQVSSDQPNVTIQGQFPGGGGCSTSLGGFMQGPDYFAGSVEYGAMAVLSDAASTIVSGIRIKGAAIGTPGHSGHFGNISLGGATSQANNNVADVIQTGPTLSGNQTNTAYGGC